MAALTVQTLAESGIVLSTTTPTATTGDTFVNNGKTWLEVANNSGSSINVTVTSYAVADRPGLAATDRVVAVANGATKKIGPFDPRAFNSPSTGLATVVCSAVSSVTIAALTLP